MVSVVNADDLGDINDDPDEIQTGEQERTKEVLPIDRRRKLFRENKKARISSDEDIHVIHVDGRKNRRGRDFRLVRENHSCDASFGRHTCNLSTKNMQRDLTKNRGNRNVKLYMDESSLFYGAKMHRQFGLQ